MYNRNKLRKFFLAGSITLSSVLGFFLPASAATLGENVADRADNYVGLNIRNYDSSDFVSYVFDKVGTDIPNNLVQLSREGELIHDQSNLQPGDILFFGTSSNNLLAAGIYTGERKFIIAYQPYQEIKRLSLDSKTAQKYYLGAKRILNDTEGDKQNDDSDPQANSTREKIIKTGKKYLGTPYEFGSNRSNIATFDCSDFVRQAYLEGAGINLPYNSRTQAEFILEKGNYTSDWRKLKPGDIMFFYDYKGWQLDNYDGINPFDQRISHNGIYLGNGKILHTYSKESGGVRIDKIEGRHWEERFIFGGSPLE